MKIFNEIEAELKELLSKTPSYTHDPKYHRFQGYEHKVTVRPRTMEMVIWCNKHCKSDYSLDANSSAGDVVSFKNKDDAILFKLTWGGAV